VDRAHAAPLHQQQPIRRGPRPPRLGGRRCRLALGRVGHHHRRQLGDAGAQAVRHAQELPADLRARRGHLPASGEPRVGRAQAAGPQGQEDRDL